jgi:hypothetical protein
MEEELQNRKKKRDYLVTWLQNFGQAQEMVPRVQKELEKTEWEIDALSNLPEEAAEIPSGDITVVFDKDLRYLPHALPMIPSFDAGKLSSSDAISSSGTMSVYEYVARIGDIGTPIAFEYSNHYTLEYQEIQLAHDRPNEVRNLLDKLPSKSTGERFERAEESYMQFKAGNGEKTSAAMEMRTFLDGLSGELFQVARKWEKENMTWETMAERLSKGDISEVEYSEMIRQKGIHSSLINRLSDIGKDREGGSAVNLNHIWTELIDHAFTILSIVDL